MKYDVNMVALEKHRVAQHEFFYSTAQSVIHNPGRMISNIMISNHCHEKRANS